MAVPGKTSVGHCDPAQEATLPTPKAPNGNNDVKSQGDALTRSTKITFCIRSVGTSR